MLSPYQLQASAVNITASGNAPSTSKQVTAPVKRARVQLKTTAGGKAPQTVENKLANQRGHRNSMILVTHSEEEQEQNDSHSKDHQSKIGPPTDLTLEQNSLVKKRTIHKSADVNNIDKAGEAEAHQPAGMKLSRTQAIQQCNSMCNVDLYFCITSSFVFMTMYRRGRRPFMEYIGFGRELKFGHRYPFVKCQTPNQNSRDNVRLQFPFPLFNERKFQEIAELSEIDWTEVDMQMLLEDFRLRHRHLLIGDLTDEEKKCNAKRVAQLGVSSREYQDALYLLTVFLCKFDSNKATAILFCFARMCESNIRRRVNKLCRDFVHN